MFTVREYKEEDLKDCAQCFYEGFFQCKVNDNDKAFLQDYTQVLIEKSNFTYVAQVEGIVVGFICGTFQKEFNKALAKQFDNTQHWFFFIKFMLKYIFKRYHFSKDFAEEFRVFFAKIGECKKLSLGKCDCELVALTSRNGYRKGLGTALVNRMVKRCKENCTESIRLLTNTTSTYTFYEKYGFSLVEEKDYAIGENTGKSFVYEINI